MGTKLCSYHIRDHTQAEGLESLTASKSPRAYLSPPTDHWLSVVDHNCGSFDLRPLEQTVANISKRLGADVLITAVFDGDVSLYVAFHDGVEVDRYSSNSVAFEWLKGRRSFPGNPTKLSRAYTWWRGKELLESALSDDFSDETFRFNKIVQAFNISMQRAHTTFRDITEPMSPALLSSRKPGSFLDQRIRDMESYVEFKGGSSP